MTKTTFDIIDACKGNIFEEIPNRLERVIAYFSEETGSEKKFYTEEEMEKIMLNAMYDYIDTCNKPSTFLRLMANAIEPENLSDRIAAAFSLVQVKNLNGEYVNGFKEEFVKDHYINAIIPLIRKNGISIYDIEEEIEFREEHKNELISCKNDDLRLYGTYELINVRKFWKHC